MSDDTGHHPAPTRMIAVGSAALIEGFALIGFETYPDAGDADLERLLEDLVRRRQNACVILEQGLADGSGRWLKQVQAEGGRIVITEIPRLNAASQYRSRVEQLVETMLGPDAMEQRLD